MSESEEPVAVVDLGTNSCLLLVGRRRGEGLEVLLDRSEVPRMGEGLDRTGRVGLPALERLREVLAGYLAEARAPEGRQRLPLGYLHAQLAGRNGDQAAPPTRRLEHPGTRPAARSSAIAARRASVSME